VTRFSSESFDKTIHDRSSFNSGNAAIDKYFRERASQEIKADYARCYVLKELSTNKVAGYYTLSASSVPLNDLPEFLIRKLPKYPNVPTALIGRLGRDLDFKGQGVGSFLLADAINRVANSCMAAHAITAEAIDENAARFYADFGFRPLTENRSIFFLPTKTALSISQKY
jgi:GNAT superfamily N-acetyltransferase